MLNSNFCHLHIHTEYSQLDGMGSCADYAKKARELGFEYLAITDHGTVDGAIEFQKACKEEDILPVTGCEFYIVPDRFYRPGKGEKEKRAHITIFAKNKKGWTSICKALTDANLNGFYYKPRIDYQLLLGMDLEDLIISTACVASFFMLPDGDTITKELNKRTDVYFELMPTGLKEQHELHEEIFYFIQDNPEFKNKIILTNDCHYVNEEDVDAQEVLLAIQQKRNWSDPKRWKFTVKDLHLRTVDEMVNDFEDEFFDRSDLMIAIRNTTKIAKQCCSFEIKKQEISLPKMGVNEEHELETLESICSQRKMDWNDEYEKRYETELSLLIKKGFVTYFLIVYELVNWCKKNDIMVGPGRGCFLPNSLIMTDGGFKKIKDVKINDCVLSHNETWNDVSDVLSYEIEEEIVEIETIDGRMIRCTSDHKILIEKNGVEIWVEAKNLKENDNIVDILS